MLAFAFFPTGVLADPTPSPNATPTPSPSPSPPLDNASHLYTLDGYGGVHPVGSAPTLSVTGYWAGWDVARGLALFGDGTGGYTLDAFGGLHPVGSAPYLTTTAAWPGWDIARGIATLNSSSASDPAGYILDGWGGIHAFGSAPAMTPSGYWTNWDIARGIAVFPDGSGGYVLDGFGGLHPFGSAPYLSAGSLFSGWDIARGVALLPDASAANPAGYILDGWGGLHPFGGAPAVTAGGYWPNWDIARGVVTWTAAPAGSPGGWTLDGHGGVHAFGSAPALVPSGYWSWDIARGLSGPGADTEAKAPPPPPVGHRKVVVSLTQQHLWAYNPDGTLFLQTVVTTGMAALPTDQGDFKVIMKRSPYEFISPWPVWSPFWYPDAWVNWAAEFVSDGTFLHDAPWEPSWAFGPGSEYGAYASHGCVHVPNAPMQALYGWLRTGDEVLVKP